MLSRGWGVLRWDVCLVVLPRDQEVGRARTHLERTEQPGLLERREGPGGPSVASNAKARVKALAFRPGSGRSRV